MTGRVAVLPQVGHGVRLVVHGVGTVLGEVGGLELGAAQDRLVILLPDGREAQVPFVAALVPEVDLEAGRVVVDAPPGLLDLGV